MAIRTPPAPELVFAQGFTPLLKNSLQPFVFFEALNEGIVLMFPIRPQYHDL